MKKSKRVLFAFLVCLLLSISLASRYSFAGIDEPAATPAPTKLPVKKSADPAKQLFDQAQLLLNQGENEAAIKVFEGLISAYPLSSYSIKAKSIIGNLAAGLSISSNAYNLMVRNNGKILFDTTHREWGTLYGAKERELISGFGNKIDMLSIPDSMQTITEINFRVTRDGTHNMYLDAIEEYPYIWLWLKSGGAMLDVQLDCGGKKLSGMLWYRTSLSEQYHPVVFDNPRIRCYATFKSTHISGNENYADDKVILAASSKPPISADVISNYGILWFHNPLNPFLTQEQNNIVSFLDNGGSILHIENAKDGGNLKFALKNKWKDIKYPNGVLHLYYLGQGRIAWFEPHGNPYLYVDTSNKVDFLTENDIEKLLAWLGGNAWQ